MKLSARRRKALYQTLAVQRQAYIKVCRVSHAAALEQLYEAATTGIGRAKARARFLATWYRMNEEWLLPRTRYKRPA